MSAGRRQNRGSAEHKLVTAVDFRFESGDLKTVAASSDKVNRDGESHQTRLANDKETTKESTKHRRRLRVNVRSNEAAAKHSERVLLHVCM